LTLNHDIGPVFLTFTKVLTFSKMRDGDKILVEKLEGKRPFRRCRHGWKDNIKIHVTDTGYGGYGLFHLAQYRVQWLL
jgi:hypothetical protein